MSLRGVGIDIVDVARISRLINARGEAFTGRWFNPAEIAECSASEQPARSFAGRLAAKEAVWKSLGLDGSGQVPWRSIVVLTVGETEKVSLLDGMAAAAGAGGVGQVSVSTTSLDDLAMAVAMAWCAV